MPDTYSSDDLPFTAEDWTDPNHLEVIAACRNVTLSNAAAKAYAAERPDRLIVARWGRGWTTWRSVPPDPEKT
jgi:hypothetical protein